MDDSNISLAKDKPSFWQIGRLSPALFFVSWFVYAVVSSFATFITSSGWTAIMLGFVGFVFYGILTLVILGVSLNRIIVRRSSVRVNLRVLFVMLISQAIFLLGNSGDCGDVNCTHPPVFSYRILYMLGLQETAFSTIFVNVVSLMSGFALSIYVIAVIVFIATTFFSGGQSGSSAQSSITTIGDSSWAKRVKQLAIVLFVGVVIPLSLYIFYFKPVTDCSNDYDPDGCYYSKAVRSEKIENCDKISDSYERGSCYGELISAGDENKCSSLDSLASRNVCFFGLATKTQNRYLCDKIVDATESSEDDKLKDNCYIGTISAENGIDVDECESLTSVATKNSCYHEAAMVTMSRIWCDKISPDAISLKSGCYDSVARETNDYTICGEVKDYRRDSCYWSVAAKTRNPLACSFITRELYWNNCYIALARSMNDIQLCDKLIGEDVKQNCRNERTK